MKPYDYLIVGAGLFGAVFAHEMKARGKRCLVLERRAAVGGNIRTEERDGIHVHVYGAHIFHTNDERVWAYVNRFAALRPYIHSPLANFRGALYPLPFNMNTFRAMWGVRTPEEARARILAQQAEVKGSPRNLEEQAISLVGRDIYETLIKGYTEKQWGRPCRELPAFIIRRLPVRYTYDNNYFDARHQGIPIGGYTQIIEGLLGGIEVRTGVDYNAARAAYAGTFERLVYTGALDAYFDYRLGALAYRSLRFETKRIEEADHQGVAVVNYTAKEIPYTRVIEHKHFVCGKGALTWVTHEYPADWKRGAEAYYPIGDGESKALYARYAALAAREKHLVLGGRLARYRYYDMDQVVAAALAAAEQET